MIYKPPTFCHIYFLQGLKHRSVFLCCALDFLRDRHKYYNSESCNLYGTLHFSCCSHVELSDGLSHFVQIFMPLENK